MRVTLLATAFAALSLSTHAAPMPAGQSCIALGQGASRVAALVADPADCCRGRMQCAQFLSTTTVVKPAREQRT